MSLCFNQTFQIKEIRNSLFVVFLLLSACTHIGDGTSHNSSTNECAVKSSRILKGQIRYLEGMTLKIHNCETYYSSKLHFKNKEAITPIVDQIDFGARTKPQYFDVIFTGFIDWKGKLIIKSVESAEVSGTVIF